MNPRYQELTQFLKQQMYQFNQYKKSERKGNSQDFMKILREAQHLIEQGTPELEKVGYENTLVLGTTRGGKSTLVNYLLSNRLRAEKLNPDSKGLEGKKLKVVKDGDEKGPMIGTSCAQETIIPQMYHSQNGAYNKPIWYCPGLADNRGAAIEIANAFLVSQLLKKAKNVKIILVSNVNDIISDNTQVFTDLMKQIKYLFGDSNNFLGSVMLVVTNVDRSYDVDDLAEDIKCIAYNIKDPGLDKTLLNHLSQEKNISIFYKTTQAGPLQTQNAKQIADDIDSKIYAKPYLNVSIGISPDTKTFIYENQAHISEYLKEDLRILFTQLRQIIAIDEISTTEDAQQAVSDIDSILRIFLIQTQNADLKSQIQFTLQILEQRQISTDLSRESIGEKLKLLDFVESVMYLRVAHSESFLNDTISVFNELQRNLNTKFMICLIQESQLIKQESEKKIKLIQEEQKNKWQAFAEENEKLKIICDYQARQLAQLTYEHQNTLRLMEQQQGKKGIWNNFYNTFIK